VICRAVSFGSWRIDPYARELACGEPGFDRIGEPGSSIDEIDARIDAEMDAKRNATRNGHGRKAL